MDFRKQLVMLSAPGRLFRQLDNGRLECYACAHRCRIAEGNSGICNVRFHLDGELKVPFNYISGLQVDPIEKKPFYHALPQASALSFGMLGCDLHCNYCQNWITSQSLRDDQAGISPREISIDDILHHAKMQQVEALVSTYNEPLISAEWSTTIFEQAKREGLTTGFVSNGNATPEVLDFIRPVTDLYKVDLKAFRDDHYRKLGARLENILEAIAQIKKRGFWLELVTLLVPGFNDDIEELSDMAEFIAGIDPSIPWHITAFHPDYHLQDNRKTRAKDLITAAKIGKEQGLQYIYAGNLPNQVGHWEDTRCHNCQAILVKRRGFSVIDYWIDSEGKCPNCRVSIPGIWREPPARDSLIRLIR